MGKRSEFISVASRPGMMRFWDFELNDDDPATVSVYSTDPCHWKCPDCGYPWTTRVATRARAKPKCPYHELDMAIWPGHNDLLTLHPEAAETYDFEKNQDIDITTLGAHSTTQVNWKCPVCGYSWPCSVKKRTNAKFKCPCHNQGLAIQPGYNDAFTLVPELEDWLDKEALADMDVDPYSQGLASTVPLPWECPICYRKFTGPIANRLKKDGDTYVILQCLDCYRKSQRTAPPIAAVPKLIRFWDPENNPGLDPNLLSSSYREPVQWRCKKCGHKWPASPHGRMKCTSGCPCCGAKKRIQPGINDVLTRFPEISETFDEKLNPGIDLSTLAPGSSCEITWSCACGNIWTSKLLSRFTRKNGKVILIGCQKCNSKLRRKMTYADEYPELDKMFDVKRNGRSLASVTSKESTTVKFWWICQQCHRPFFACLTTVIKGQQYRSKGCPYCAHKRLVGGDSFAELHPDLMDEYDSDNTIDPFKVFPSDTNHANWVCRKNPAHKWEASFLARHMGYGKCPVCYHTRVYYFNR